jgi:hypothetical protein
MKSSSLKRAALSALLLCSVFFMLLPLDTMAQGPGMPGGPDYDPDREVPVDGGTAILLAAGLAYGIKKIRQRPLS